MERLSLQPKMSRMSFITHLNQLDTFLVESKYLWQPQPFTTARPAWCSAHPALTRALLDLDEASLTHIAASNAALIGFISAYIPQLTVIPSLIELAATPQKQQGEIEPWLSAGIPGRKWQQITSLYQSIENPGRPITEWCGGKGYLGRLLSKQWQQQVITLEKNLRLVEEGAALADKYSVQQHLIVI